MAFDPNQPFEVYDATGARRIDAPATTEPKKSWFRSVAEALAAPALKTAETGKRAAVGIIGVGAGLGAKAIGADALASRLLSATQSYVDPNRARDYGVFGQVKPVVGTRDAAATGLELASYLPVTRAATVPIKLGFRGLLKEAAKVGIKEGAFGGGLQGGATAVRERMTPADAIKSVVKGIGIGAATGAIAGPAIGTAGRAVAGAARAVKYFTFPDPAQALTRAVKPRIVKEFVSSFRSAEDDLAEAIGRVGSPKNIADLQNVVQDAKRNVWSAYDELLGARRSESAVNGANIASAIRSKISANIRKFFPSAASEMERMATEFETSGVFSAGQAEETIQFLNTALEAFYRAGQPDARYVQDALATAAKEMRDQLYTTLDVLESKAPGTARELKKRYGSLIKLGNDVDKRANVVLRSNQATLQETINYPFAVARGIGSVLRGDLFGGIEALGQMGASRALRAANSTDSLIERAFRGMKVKLPTPKKSIVAENIPPVSPKTAPGEAIVPKTGEVPSATESLLQEARKYRTAEEFVKAKTNAYHGSAYAKDIERTGEIRASNRGELGRGFYFGRTKDSVRGFEELPNATKLKLELEGRGNEVFTGKEGTVGLDLGGLNIKQITMDDVKAVYASIREGSPNAAITDLEQAVADKYKALGYDGIEVKSAKQGVIFPEALGKIKTKSQLTSLWEQANKGRKK